MGILALCFPYCGNRALNHLYTIRENITKTDTNDKQEGLKKHDIRTITEYRF